jgi:hypothetical protein
MTTTGADLQYRVEAGADGCAEFAELLRQKREKISQIA